MRFELKRETLNAKEDMISFVCLHNVIIVING